MIPEETIIAIDGPAGAGKSSVARHVAQRLGYTHIDTGAMYRALTLKALRTGLSPKDGKGMSVLAADTVIEFKPDFENRTEARILLDGQDVTREIRSRLVNQNVSVVAQHPEVRNQMVRLQRAMASRGRVVMDGRDIGTVVVPNAGLKVFLTASLEERARRRHKDLELMSSESHMNFGSVVEAVASRDKMDSEREAAPLRMAPDAHLIDTTHLDMEEVVEIIVNLAMGGEK